MNQAQLRAAAAVVINVACSYVVSGLVYSMLSTVLWAWVASVFAILLGMAAGITAHTYVETSGYDLAVGGCAKALSFVRGLRA